MPDNNCVDALPDADARPIFDANTAALLAAQGHCFSATFPTNARRTRARDGTWTLQEPDGKWWGGCSVPMAAARELLRKLELRGITGCFLKPTHPAQIIEALRLLRPEQAIIAIVPDPDQFARILACEPLDDPINAGRLYFAPGPQWERALSDLLARWPGLPTPQQFIRTSLVTEDQATRLMPGAQRAFSQDAQAKANRLADLRRRSVIPGEFGGRALVFAGTRFSLWNDAGPVLRAEIATAGTLNASHLDPDCPRTCGGLALALAAAQADLVIAANHTRAELGTLLPDAQPLLTWLTVAAIPPWQANCPNDRLLVVDPLQAAAAKAAGWPDASVCIAPWPAHSIVAEPTDRVISIIADVCDVTTPGRPLELSSHSLLWDLIRDELLARPFSLGNDAAAYLKDRMRRLGVSPDGLDAAFFLDRLVWPAFFQGIARLLHGASIPLALYGHGWDRLPDLQSQAKGPVRSQDELRTAASRSAALVRPAVGGPMHAVEALGRPILRPDSAADSFLRIAKAAAKGALTMPAATDTRQSLAQTIKRVAHELTLR